MGIFKRESDVYGKKTTALESLLNKVTGSGLTGAEEQANNFSSAEAEIARQWQEDMYLKYQSPAAMIDQYKDAGLNPGLMYGGASSSSPSFNSSSPSSVSPQSGSGLSDIISTVTSLSKLKADIDNTNADTELKKTAASLNSSNVKRIEELTPVEKELTAKRIQEVDKNISYLEAQRRAALAEEAYKGALQANAEQQNEWIDKINEVEIMYKEMMTAKGEAEKFLIGQQIKNLKQELNESVSRVLVNQANAGLLTRETKNLAEEMGLIVRNKTKVDLENEALRFTVGHLTGDRNWKIAGQVFDMMQSAAMTAGAAATGTGQAMKGVAAMRSITGPLTPPANISFF